MKTTCEHDLSHLGVLRVKPMNVVALLCWPLLVVGCATSEGAMERELDMLKREMAGLHAGQAKVRRSTPPAFDPYDPYGYNTPGQRAYGPTNPAGPPPVPRAPTTAPPPLPVVKLDPLQTNPFADGTEPPIRVGRRGRIAPRAARAAGPLEYDRIDPYGNLLDETGRVVYRAGDLSAPIDTHPGDDMAYRLYEDPHESPAAKVARGTRVPYIPRPGEAYGAHTAGLAPGVYGLDDGQPVALPGSSPGIEPIALPRVRQFSMEDRALSRDGGPSIRVDEGLTYGSPDPRILDHIPLHELPVAHLLPQPQPVPELTAPVLGPPASTTFPAPRHAPGPRKVTRQRTYKRTKEKLVKRLYKTAYNKMREGQPKAALKLFEKILTRYGNHELADNALYWLGETAYSEHNWRQALTWFQDVVVRYPQGNKLPDAMLKSALCYVQLGERDFALRMLSEIESLFAAAPVAQVARQRRLALAGQGGG